MTNSLIAEYHIMEKRYKKLVSEGKQLEKEHEQDVKYFIENNISDNKQQRNLEKTACYLASSSITLKISKNKMNQIRTTLFNAKIKKN